jgi:hypothetical protein
MSCELGLDAKFYYEAALEAGTLATASWVEVDLARDVSTSASADEADTSDRRSVFKTTCPSLLTLESSLQMTYENGDTKIKALRDQFLARKPILIAVMDGPIATTGSEGFVFWANIYSNDFAQPLTDGCTVDVTFRPAVPPTGDATTTPQWYEVS